MCVAKSSQGVCKIIICIIATLMCIIFPCSYTYDEERGRAHIIHDHIQVNLLRLFPTSEYDNNFVSYN